MPFDNPELFSFIRTINIEFNVSEWGNETTNFSEFSDEGLANLESVVFANGYGRILFLGVVGILEDLILDGNVVISNNSVFINSSELLEFNVSAELSLYGLDFDVPRVLRDGVVCSDYVVGNYSNGTVVFNVSGFSEYVVEEGSCFDGVRNFNETGVDCGEICSVICSVARHHSGGSSGVWVASPVVEEVIEDVSEDNVSESVEVEENEEAIVGKDVEGVITGNVVSVGDYVKSWKGALVSVVLILVVVYFFMKKND